VVTILDARERYITGYVHAAVTAGKILDVGALLVAPGGPLE
jgi:hypothetical protein